MTEIAIIGGGPRGLWAAEELITLARERGTHVHIDVYNDGEPGAVGAYEVDQPDEWLINVRSSAIRTHLGSFDDWRDRHDDPFPPRRLVGEFLAESWTHLGEHLPAGSTLTHHPRRISELTPDGDCWRIGDVTYDEVLLATGHAEDFPGSLRHTDLGVPVLTPYPATNLATITDRDRVLVRGAALTFIDVTRACPAAVFLPVTRTGRFMEVKPVNVGIDRADIITDGQARIREVADLAGLVGVLADVAAQLLDRADGVGGEDEIRAVLDGTDGSGDPVADLRASYEAATGARPASAAWAVGLAWLELYPAIVERASYTGRDTLDGFGDLCRRLERVGFGPPPESAAGLLTLIDAGRIDTAVLSRGAEPLADLVAETGATVVVDAVIAPPGVVPGTLEAWLVDQGHARIRPGTRGLDVDPDGRVAGQEHLSAVGRMTEDVVLGNDTLSRTLHDVIPRWASRVITGPEQVHGIPPLTARTEEWADKLLADSVEARRLVGEFGSPVNVLNASPMLDNIAELVDAGASRGVDVHVFFARKANKGLVFVDTVRDAGHGVDVASERELRQVLGRGVDGERIILSAAIKPDALLEHAVANGVTISADGRAELDRIAAIARRLGTTAHVAPRLAPDPATLPPTRFGERSAQWAQHLARPVEGVEIVGLHVHLHGYAASDRQTALRECLTLVDSLVAAGHHPRFIDLGGGIPMSYLDDAQQWEDYRALRRAMIDGHTRPFTWKSDPLDTTYPYHQSPTRGAWLQQVLSDGIAEGLTSRGLRLHLEPGRSVLDGCGLILAEVAFVKQRSDGLPLIGLAMNRTQCRTTSDDYLVDPILVTDRTEGEEVEAFLVGAYCIEDELILRRRIRFPRGVEPGEVIGIPNTAGYFMHILESASHQIPLAKNVVWPPGELDDIDRG